MRSGKTNHSLQVARTGKDILLTGIPRSGTTLACRLLCDFSQTVALNEPMDRDQFANPGTAEYNIGLHFSRFRKSLLKDGSAVARTKDGVITDNAYSAIGQQRKRVVERTAVTFDKNLGESFNLVMKHCAEFSLLLPHISEVFSTYAIIRNPLALLDSWVSVHVPVSRGKVAKSARLNPEFHTALAGVGDDLLKRQLFILSWYFGQYLDFQPGQIIRYERMVEDPVGVLGVLARGESPSPVPSLQNRNAHVNSSREKILEIGEALLGSEGHYWDFYSRDEVRELLHEMTKNEQ